jgi:hypothetical protein
MFRREGTYTQNIIATHLLVHIHQKKEIALEIAAKIASGFRPNKTRPSSLLNGFKHDHKFNRYTALLVFFI